MATTNHSAEADHRRVQQAERILELRRRRRLSQQDAANAVGVSVRAYADWEKGRANPKGTNLIKLAKVFKSNADFIEYGTARLPTSPAMADWAIEKRLQGIEERVLSLDELQAELNRVCRGMSFALDRLVKQLDERDALAVVTELFLARSALAEGSPPAPPGESATDPPLRHAADRS